MLLSLGLLFALCWSHSKRLEFNSTGSFQFHIMRIDSFVLLFQIECIILGVSAVLIGELHLPLIIVFHVVGSNLSWVGILHKSVCNSSLSWP